MKCIIAGGRDFNDFILLEKIARRHLNRKTIIISGTAKGADELGEMLADKYFMEVEKFPADWDKYGKAAGYKRNEQMAKHVGQEGMLLAFWDGESKGTKHMIDLACKHRLKVLIIFY